MAWADHYRYDKYLYIHPAETVFAARVNQGSFTYPMFEVTFDTVTTGAWGDIQYGMTILFGSTAGASDLGRQRVRGTGDSATLLIGWSSRGRRDGEVNLADDAYITILDDYRAWARIPRIANDGTLYKDYILSAGIGLLSPPVANGGVGILDFVDSSTGVITKDFDGTDSFPTSPGATIDTYAWDFVDGTPSSSANSTEAGVTFPAGFRWVTLTITDSNAVQHAHRIPVAALSNIGNEADYSGSSYSESTAEGSNTAEKAFDNNLSTRWETTDGFITGWAQITLSADITIAAYRISCDAVQIPKNPVDFTLKIGAGLTTADTQSGISWSGTETKQFNLAAPVTSNIFRIDVTLNNGGNNVAIQEIDLLLEGANYFTKFEVTTQTLTRNGQSFNVMIHEDVPADTYYDGALIMYGEDEYYNDVKGSLAGPSGRENVKFIGWHDTDPASLAASDSTYITTTEFSCVDIGGRMRQLPAFPQAVLRDADPGSWLELKAANTDRYVHYLLHWHSTVLDVAPFTWAGTGETYALPRFQSPGQNLFEQIAFRAASIAHELTVTMRGQLGLTVDPQLQDSGDRTNTVITDIDPADWMTIQYTHQRPPRAYWLWGNSVVANTQEADASDLVINAVFCVAPGKAPGQGETEQTQGEQLVADQDELNAREGHRYAVRLNPFETFFDFALAHPGDIGIDPALMVWVRATITSALASQRGLTLTDERFLPFEVDIVHNNITQTKEIFLRAEREREGTPVSTVVVETGTVLPDTPDIEDWPYIWEDETGGELFRGQQTIAMFDNSSQMNITNDFATPEASNGPTWVTTDLTGLSPALSGNYLAMVGDPFSPKYLDTGDTVNGWILTDTSIYSITDVFGVAAGPTLALQHTLATANVDYGDIGISIGVQNWVVANINYNDAVGAKAVYTTDGGSTWNESVIAANYDDTPAYWGANNKFPLYLSGRQAGLVYASAYTAIGANPPSTLYKSTDFGATWAVAGSPSVDFGNAAGGTFNIPWHDNAGQLLNYHTKYNLGGNTYGLNRTEADGVTITDITPTGSDVGVLSGFWGLSVCPIDRQRVAIAGYRINPSPDQTAVYVSKDAGDTWTQATPLVTANSDSQFGIGIAGNDSDVIYAWGSDLTVFYSQDFGQTWEDKSANLVGAATIRNILGG